MKSFFPSTGSPCPVAPVVVVEPVVVPVVVVPWVVVPVVVVLCVVVLCVVLPGGSETEVVGGIGLVAVCGACVSADASLSPRFASRSTAVICPTKKRTAAAMNHPRYLPGNCGRARGTTSATMSAKAMKAIAEQRSPIW